MIAEISTSIRILQEAGKMTTTRTRSDIALEVRVRIGKANNGKRRATRPRGPVLIGGAALAVRGTTTEAPSTLHGNVDVITAHEAVTGHQLANIARRLQVAAATATAVLVRDRRAGTGEMSEDRPTVTRSGWRRGKATTRYNHDTTTTVRLFFTG